jgi:shikimate kinase
LGPFFLAHNLPHLSRWFAQGIVPAVKQCRIYHLSEAKSMAMTGKNIALVGFRASGKSALGRVLAERLHWTFVDMDEALTASCGPSIAAWVQAHGWEAFRQAEADLLRELASQQGLVVATGGGVVIRAENRKCLREAFLVVWLQASPETLHTRLLHDPKSGAQRPALTELPLQQEITTLLAQRAPWYREVAALTLTTDAQEPATLLRAILTGMGRMDRI